MIRLNAAQRKRLRTLLERIRPHMEERVAKRVEAALDQIDAEGALSDEQFLQLMETLDPDRPREAATAQEERREAHSRPDARPPSPRPDAPPAQVLMDYLYSIQRRAVIPAAPAVHRRPR